MIVGPPLRRLVRALARLVADDRGATAVEYGMIAAVIILTMVVAFKDVANSTVSMWGNVNTKVENAR